MLLPPEILPLSTPRGRTIARKILREVKAARSASHAPPMRRNHRSQDMFAYPARRAPEVVSSEIA
jgi:hypothetical protein